MEVTIIALPDLQKQPPKCVLRQRKISENMRQIYGRTPIPKCDFDNFAMKPHFDMGALLHLWRAASGSSWS